MIRFAILATPLLVMGCMDAGDDPCAAANSDITLGNLVGNSLSGSYEACLGDKRGELAAIRLENSELRANAERLRRERAVLNAEERRLLAEEAALRRDLDILSRSSDPDAREVARVRDRQRELNRQFGLIFS